MDFPVITTEKAIELKSMGNMGGREGGRNDNYVNRILILLIYEILKKITQNLCSFSSHVLYLR